MRRLISKMLPPVNEKATASITVTEADSIAFAPRYDPQPMHLDSEAAGKGPFGGLIASGWQTAVLVMRLMVDAQPRGGAPILGLAKPRPWEGHRASSIFHFSINCTAALSLKLLNHQRRRATGIFGGEPRRQFWRYMATPLPESSRRIGPFPPDLARAVGVLVIDTG